MGGAKQFEGRLAKGVIARLVKDFVKDAERLEGRAAAREAARTVEKDAAKDAAKNGGKLSKAFKDSYRERFFGANPGTRGKVWVHHSLEKNLEKRYPGLFSEQEIHELASLRGIPNEINPDLHLSNIRRMWDGFAEEFPHATRDQVRAFRDFIDDRWGAHMNPPVR